MQSTDRRARPLGPQEREHSCHSPAHHLGAGGGVGYTGGFSMQLDSLPSREGRASSEPGDDSPELRARVGTLQGAQPSPDPSAKEAWLLNPAALSLGSLGESGAYVEGPREE